jgi:hypothetical protein
MGPVSRSNGLKRLKIKRGLCVACDLPDHIGAAGSGFLAATNRHVKDKQVGTPGELSEAGIGAGLIRPEHERTISNIDPVRKRRDVPFGTPNAVSSWRHLQR